MTGNICHSPEIIASWFMWNVLSFQIDYYSLDKYIR